MTFKPSTNGWAFEDTFEVDGPALGLGTAPPSMGLGGGMCWAALDRYLDGRTTPDLSTPPVAGSPLHSELRQRQVAALGGVWSRIRAWQVLPDASWRDRVRVPLTPGRGDVASLTRREWPRIRRSLKAGRPILLTLLEPEDGYARGAAARQVLACAWTREGRSIVLSIYDPRRPAEDDVRLAFSLRGPLDARTTGGERVRGFFAVPYDRRPGAALRAETFGDRSVLGLNRKVRGRPGAAAGRRALHLVARDPDGALLHFHRRDGRHWEAVNVSEREDLGAHELHSDPAALGGTGGMRIHAFARNYVGDLLHFRGPRRWRVANRTEHRRAGARYRLDGNPVPVGLPFGGICVVGRGKDGALVAYSSLPLRGWRAEEVPPAGGGAITGDPVAARTGAVVHVVGRGSNGHLLHFERTKGGWSAGDLMALCPGSERVTGAPVLIVHEGRLHLFARSESDRLLHMQRDEEGQWKAGFVAEELAGDPAATNGPGGLHAFAPAAAGGLVHAWSAGPEWRVEDVVTTRPGLPRDATPDTGLVAWGSGDELRVLGRRGGALMEWVWRADTDWVAGPISERAGVKPRHEPAEDPLLVEDRAGGFHLLATDGTGTVVHVESWRWQPGVDGRSPAVRRKRAPAAAPDGAGAEGVPSGDLVAAAAPVKGGAGNAAAAAPVKGGAGKAPAPAPVKAGAGNAAAAAAAQAKPKQAAKTVRPAAPAAAAKSAGAGKPATPAKKGDPGGRPPQPKRVPVPAAAGLPLLDDADPEPEEDGGAMDLPLLDAEEAPAAEAEAEPESVEEWEPILLDAEEAPAAPPAAEAEPESVEEWEPTLLDTVTATPDPEPEPGGFPLLDLERFDGATTPPKGPERPGPEDGPALSWPEEG